MLGWLIGILSGSLGGCGFWSLVASLISDRFAGLVSAWFSGLISDRCARLISRCVRRLGLGGLSVSSGSACCILTSFGSARFSRRRLRTGIWCRCVWRGLLSCGVRLGFTFFGKLPDQAQMDDIALIAAKLLAKGETKLASARGIVRLSGVEPKPARRCVGEERQIHGREKAAGLDDLAQFVELGDTPVIKAREGAVLGDLERTLPGQIGQTTLTTALAMQTFGALLPDKAILLVADDPVFAQFPAFFIELVLWSATTVESLGRSARLGLGAGLGLSPALGCDQGRQQPEPDQQHCAQSERAPW